MGEDVEKSDASAPGFDGEGLRHPDDDPGLSLDQLSQAYLELLNRGEDPYQSGRTDEARLPSEVGAEPVAQEGGEPDGCDVTPRSILEAMLFVGTPDNRPLASRQIASLMRGVRPQEIDQLVRELNETYDAEGCPYRIISVGAGFRMVLGDQYHALREKFYGRVKEARLSQAAIDVLAIVAYNQPLTRGEVDHLRGKPSGNVLSQLVRRRLLAIQRPADKPRAARYVTTDRFLDLFGLESLDDLPRSQELDRAL